MSDATRHEDHWLFTDASNNVWKVYRQSVPKKRGYYTRWYGDALNNKSLSVSHEKTKTEVINNIKARYGVFIKPKKEKKNNLSKYLVH